MLEATLKKLNFYKDVKFETKGNQLLVRSNNRTLLQEKTEEYFRKSKIRFKPRKKITELNVENVNQVLVFKPLMAKGVGGLNFEDALKEDLDNWFKGASVKELTHGDTVEGLQKLLSLKQDSRFYCEKVGAANTKRPPVISTSKLTVTNNEKGKVADLNIKLGNVVKHHLSLKFTNSFYVYNATVINYFKSPSPNIRKMVNEFFGFDGYMMGKAYGKEYEAKTIKNYNYTTIRNRFIDIIKQILGPDIVTVAKIKNGVNYLNKISGLNHKVTITGLDKNSYGYAIKGQRKYSFIRFDAIVNGHSYQIDFQFRGTTATDTGPRYLRVLFKAK
jgi:hypothetical protein